MLAKETHENVVRFAPPLIISREELEAVLPAIREVLSQEMAATPA
jgi:ornithine--oxo-acid transaminase